MTMELAPERTEIVEDMPVENIINDAFIERLEKATTLYQSRYLPLCFKLTNEADWVNHGKADQPKFSLQASGAEKLCNPFGITWERPVVHRHDREDTKGKYYEYEIEGIVHCRTLARYGWFTGNCDSRDKFFTARGDFSEGDIRKSAFSNWVVNAVTRLVGMRNPSPEMLAKAGLDLKKVTAIDYSGRRTPERDQEAISEAQGKRLWAVARANQMAEESLKDFLKGFGYESIKEIKRKDYDELVKQIDKAGVANAKP